MRLRASFGWLASPLPGRSLAVAALTAGILAWPGTAWGSSALPTSSGAYAVAAQLPDDAVRAGLNALNEFTATSQDALARGDVTAAQAAYTLFDNGWQAIEDNVRNRSRTDYRSIEDAMSEANHALNTEPIDTAQASAMLGELRNRVEQFVATLPTS